MATKHPYSAARTTRTTVPTVPASSSRVGIVGIKISTPRRSRKSVGTGRTRDTTDINEATDRIVLVADEVDFNTRENEAKASSVPDHAGKKANSLLVGRAVVDRVQQFLVNNNLVSDVSPDRRLIPIVIEYEVDH
jgi:hypothetical protein